MHPTMAMQFICKLKPECIFSYAKIDLPFNRGHIRNKPN